MEPTDDRAPQGASANQTSSDPQSGAEATDSDVLEGEAGTDDDVRSDIPPDRPYVLDMEDPSGDAEGELDGPGARRGMRLVDPADDDVDVLDEEPDAVAGEVPAGDLAPEEGAVHETDAPPMGRDGDGYL